MSATAPVGTAACTACGMPLEHDQEWCLECGRARTLIHSPPDWRVPVIVVGTIVLAALVAFAIALINLSNIGNTGAARAGSTAATAPSQALTTPTTASNSTSTATTQTSTAAAVTTNPTPHAIASWPAGLSGWTVILAQTQDQASAEAAAQQLAAKGLGVGVIDSSQHPHLQPGQWMVYLGRYPDQAEAQAAAGRLVAAGHTGATAVEVAPPGGI